MAVEPIAQQFGKGVDKVAQVDTAGASGAPSGRPIRNADLDRLATGAALDAVLGTAARLRMPDLIEFLR